MQTEDDQDFIRGKRIDSNFVLTNAVVFWILVIVYYFRAAFECASVVVAVGGFKFWGERKLKAMSVRSIWLELAQSFATFDFPFLLYVKLGWTLNLKRGRPGYEYDPETNRHDAVSSSEEL